MAPDLILFLAANSSNTSRLALDSECSAIERELRMAAHRDFDFQSRWAVTVDELMHHLNALQPTVVHFSGHGVTPRAQGGGPGDRRDADPAGYPGESGIYLENDHREAQLVTGNALTRMIRSTAASVRMVVLNACYSGAQAEAMCEAVDCVVGMGGAIADDTARAFAVSFYRALGHRRSVANAVEQAAATIAGKRLPGCGFRKFWRVNSGNSGH